MFKADGDTCAQKVLVNDDGHVIKKIKLILIAVPTPIATLLF